MKIYVTINKMTRRKYDNLDYGQLDSPKIVAQDVLYSKSKVFQEIETNCPDLNILN